MNARPAVLSVIALLAATCIALPAPPLDCSDPDTDGFLPEGCETELTFDCEEGNSNRFPGNPEICSNEVDEDCTGTDLDCEDLVPGMTIATNDNLTVVRSDGALGYSVSFDANFGQQLTSIILSRAPSVQNILRPPVLGDDEIGSGAEFWPYAFSWSLSESPTFTILDQGPAVIRIRIDWKSDTSATQTVPLFEGNFTYTFYPDGRIFKDVQLAIESETSGGLTNYVVLNAPTFSNVAWNTTQDDGSAPVENTIPSGFIFSYQGDSQDLGWICARSQSEEIALSWSHHESGTEVPGGLRISQANSQGGGPVEYLGLFSDFQIGVVPASRNWRANTMMVLSEVGNCERGAALSAFFTHPPTPDLSAGHLTTSSPGDRDSDGFNEAAGFYALEFDSNYIDLSFSEALGNATFLLSAGSDIPPKFSLAQKPLIIGIDVLVQAASAGEWWVVMLRDIPAEQSLNIIAP